MAEWTPEIVVDERGARRLLSDQFPELELGQLQLLGEGWDNTAWLVDERWVFRFPRREIALSGARKELAVLPQLAPQLPLPVPVPAFVGRPDEDYPWPFFGAEVVRGVELARVQLTEAERAALARPLGEFLRALHSAELDVDLPLDPIRRADMRYRVEGTWKRLAELGGAPTGAKKILDAAVVLPPPELTSVVHGDLHLRHALVSGGLLSGVIDWGDVCRSDPAVDLVLAWAALPPVARPSFFTAYGEVDEAALLRSRVLAIFLCAVLAIHARHERIERIEQESLAGLHRTLLD